MESAPALKNRGITAAGNNTLWVKTCNNKTSCDHFG